MANSKIKIDYAKRMQQIRPYVNFNYLTTRGDKLKGELASAQKRQINEYWEHIQTLTIREHQIYRARKPENLKAAQEFAQHGTKHPRLKVAFVPMPSGEHSKIKVKPGGVVELTTEHFHLRGIVFDRRKMADLSRQDQLHPGNESALKAYLESVIKKAGEYKRYVIQAGPFETAGAHTRDSVITGNQGILDLMTKYGADELENKYGKDSKKASNKHWQNWMFGINAYNFLNQKSFEKARESKHQHNRMVARERTNEKRRDKYARENSGGFWLNADSATAVRGFTKSPGKGFKRVGAENFFKAVFKDGYEEISDQE